MQIIHTPPEIFPLLQKKFGVKWDQSIIITYYPNVYCKTDISPDLVIHEGVHLKQQEEMGVENWWNLYLSDKTFRLSQELEAYRYQYQWAIENMNRQSRKQLLRKCAKDLSGPIYGNVISYQDAYDKISRV